MRVLYVEDNPLDADLTFREFRRRAPQIELVTVGTVQAAFEHLRFVPTPYDVVLTDLRLPDGDGFAVLGAVRQADLPVPVIVITGSGDDQTAVTALKAGADDYIVKQDEYRTRLPQVMEAALQRFRDEAHRRSRPIRVLYAEHTASDFEFTQRHLARHAPHIGLELAGTASRVIELLQAQMTFDLLLLDYRLPDFNAIELLRRLRQELHNPIPAVLVTGQGDEDVAVQSLRLGAADYVVKSTGYLTRLPLVIENAIYRNRLQQEQAALRRSESQYRRVAEEAMTAEQHIRDLHDQLTNAYEATLRGWSQALELRDKETKGHTERVTQVTLALARRMGIAGEDLDHIRRGALLHDIGKMGIPDVILLKPGPLTEAEWTIMRMHPVYAYEWLAPIQFLRPALDIPYSHHERWDGSGYPLGLVGEAIPIAARIFAVVDIWDALGSDRPYRPAWSQTKVREHLAKLAGSHLDPSIVPLFLELLTQEDHHAGYLFSGV